VVSAVGAAILLCYFLMRKQKPPAAGIAIQA
jgi:hypothetical protein